MSQVFFFFLQNITDEHSHVGLFKDEYLCSSFQNKIFHGFVTFYTKIYPRLSLE